MENTVKGNIMKDKKAGVFTCGDRDKKGFADLYVNGKITNTKLLLWDREDVERLQKMAEEIHNENRSNNIINN